MAVLRKVIKLPGLGCVIGTSGRHDSREFFFKFTSFVDPGSSYRVDLTNFKMELVHRTKLPLEMNPTDFVTE